MIYEDRFTDEEVKAFEELRHRLFWGKSGIDYLVGFMILLSNAKASHRYLYRGFTYGGYLSMRASRVKKIKVNKKYFTLARLLRLTSYEQILWYKNILKPFKDTLSDITDCVLGLPKNSKPETIVISSQLHVVPEFKSNLSITKQDVMDMIRDIVKHGKMG